MFVGETTPTKGTEEPEYYLYSSARDYTGMKGLINIKLIENGKHNGLQTLEIIKGTSHRLAPDEALKEKLRYVPTDFNAIVFCSVTYFVGDSQILRKANAVVDVGESLIFLDVVDNANVVLQGVEVYQEFQNE